jgi:tRNA uridine 5-carboxymethylaminomethyl modification enzyme
VSGAALICRPGEDYHSVVAKLGPAPDPLSAAEQAQVEIRLRYAAYIERNEKQLAARRDYETWTLNGLDYGRVASLSGEGLEALRRHRPATLGAAGRLRGVRESDIAALLIHLKAGRVSRETIAD